MEFLHYGRLPRHRNQTESLHFFLMLVVQLAHERMHAHPPQILLHHYASHTNKLMAKHKGKT